MSVLMEQHETWKQAHERLNRGQTLPDKSTTVVRTILLKQEEPKPEPKRLSYAARLLRRANRKKLVNHTVNEICKRHNVSPRLVIGTSRQVDVVAARYEIFGTLYGFGYTYQEIGRMFDRDHTTVMHGVRRYRGEPVRAARKAAIARGEVVPKAQNDWRIPPVYRVGGQP